MDSVPGPSFKTLNPETSKKGLEKRNTLLNQDSSLENFQNSESRDDDIDQHGITISHTNTSPRTLQPNISFNKNSKSVPKQRPRYAKDLHHQFKAYFKKLPEGISKRPSLYTDQKLKALNNESMYIDDQGRKTTVVNFKIDKKFEVYIKPQMELVNMINQNSDGRMRAKLKLPSLKGTYNPNPFNLSQDGFS